MAKKINYPVVKKALWEAWRAFLPAFSLVIFTQFEAGVDLKNWRIWALTLFGSAMLSGFKAVAKWYRDTYGQKDYSNLIYKLPI